MQQTVLISLKIGKYENKLKLEDLNWKKDKANFRKSALAIEQTKNILSRIHLKNMF